MVAPGPQQRKRGPTRDFAGLTRSQLRPGLGDGLHRGQNPAPSGWLSPSDEGGPRAMASLVDSWCMVIFTSSWCSVGKICAAPSPRSGSAAVSPRFSCSPTVRGPDPASAVTGAPDRDRWPSSRGQRPGHAASGTRASVTEFRLCHPRSALRTELAPNARPRSSGAAPPDPAPAQLLQRGYSPRSRTAGEPAPQAPQGHSSLQSLASSQMSSNRRCTGPPAVSTSSRSAREKAT